jgi:photosystem II stability/assembly factor-like uncharacterized protein
MRGLFCVPIWADWTALGPFGGSVTVVAADPHSPKTFIAGTRNALLFRSRDGGHSWTPLPFPARLQATLHTLVIDRAYRAFTLQASPAAAWNTRESFEARTPEQQVRGLRGREVRAIATRRVRSPIMAAGTDTGVFQSADGGATWSCISPAENAELQPIVALTFDPQDGATIFARHTAPALEDKGQRPHVGFRPRRDDA